MIQIIQFIHNLVTKKSHFGKHTIELMRQCLLSMLDHATKALVDGINIPMIGSGLDELNFINDVFWLLSEVF